MVSDISLTLIFACGHQWVGLLSATWFLAQARHEGYVGTWFLWDILNLEKDWSSPDFFDAVPLKFLRGEAMRGRLGKEDIPDVAGHGAIYPTPKLKIAQATLCPTSRGPMVNYISPVHKNKVRVPTWHTLQF